MLNHFKHATFSLIAIAAISSLSWADNAGTKRTTADAITWMETGFGPWAAPVSGDFSKGKHITMIKFSPGMKTPVHIHTNSYVGVMISGTTKHYEVGKPETETVLGAGSHWSVHGGVEHISECIGTVDCISVVYQDEPFDYLPNK
jgi:quercetin dioxygenase-like cupin family protein